MTVSKNTHWNLCLSVTNRADWQVSTVIDCFAHIKLWDWFDCFLLELGGCLLLHLHSLKVPTFSLRANFSHEWTTCDYSMYPRHDTGAQSRPGPHGDWLFPSGCQLLWGWCWMLLDLESWSRYPNTALCVRRDRQTERCGVCWLCALQKGNVDWESSG